MYLYYMYFKCQFRCRHNTHAHAQFDVLTCVCKYVCPRLRFSTSKITEYKKRVQRKKNEGEK